MANRLRYLYYGRQLKILSIEETAHEIICNKKSICRFGDGEMNLIYGGSIRFQRYDALLAQRLKEVFCSEENGILVCISNFFTPSKMRLRTKENRAWWVNYFDTHAHEWFQLLSKHKIYGNASISRFYIPFIDKKQAANDAIIIKQIWEGKKLLIVEGEKTRMGYGNDLLNNASEIKRIIAPSSHAFSEYDKILSACLQFPKDYMILIALGPTATVLAYDLGKEGYQALDIGHIDIEYDWMRMGAEKQIALPYKYVNEAQGGDQVKSLVDIKYLSEIVTKIEV